MPALVVWERLPVGGDDLRLLTCLSLLLRLLQISTTVSILVFALLTGPPPSSPSHPVYLTRCVTDRDQFRKWYRGILAVCAYGVAYGAVGGTVEWWTWRISGVGTPVEGERRRSLSAVCKCNMVGMLMAKMAGFGMAVVAIHVAEGYCRCVWSWTDVGGGNGGNDDVMMDVTVDVTADVTADDEYSEWEKERLHCPGQGTWLVCARILIFVMACDVLFPLLTLAIVMRKRWRTFWNRHRRRWQRDREPDDATDAKKSWEKTCQRCCECTGLLTCYLFGGQKLTAGSYVDVAVALADFLGDEGSLDIVPSDIAAAMICLVNIQKRKQIECRNQLMEEGGVLAKDKALVRKLLRSFRETQQKKGQGDSSQHRNQNRNHNKKHPQRKSSFWDISTRSRHSNSQSKSISHSRSHSQSNSFDRGFEQDIEMGMTRPPTIMPSQRQSMRLQLLAAEGFASKVPTMLEEAALFDRHDEVDDDEVDDNGQVGDERDPSTPNDPKSSLSSSSSTHTAEIDTFRKLINTTNTTSEENDHAFRNALSFRLLRSDSIEFFEPTIRRVLSQNNFVDRQVLGEGARFSRVALAAYSWMLYVYTRKCTGCCELTADTLYRWGSCRRRGENVIGDNCCGWKQASVLKSIGVRESDVLYANFNNDLGISPYIILVDRKWKTIVLAIRGTLSLEDMVSDVTISPTPLGEDLCRECGLDADWKDEQCHAGMLAGAKWIYDELKRHGLLDEAMTSREFAKFRLRVIGHSLGAGIAAILGWMLRGKYPMLRCLCFSPPGCVSTERLARESKEFTWSYVLHNDVVPRLSFDSLINFRNDLIEMIARIKVPKHCIFQSHFMHMNEDSLVDLPAKQLYEKENIPKSKFWTDFQNYKERQHQRMLRNNKRNCKMTIPGQIVHMVRTSTKLGNAPCGCLLSCCNTILSCGTTRQTKKYKVRWTEAEDFSEIYISPTMMMDHFPYNVSHALEAAAASYGITSDQEREEEEEKEKEEERGEGTKKSS
mmetsp:Transcript_15200/g.29639  ORF Transcript_15200/g.29639 Transcript_15200/m.29639 type:complete len:999 (+) Transcript_15200:251-3247(+)